ncbi:MAG TPA: FG-GAP-like repeat-containing protein, partial [Polyangia bacterium]
MFSCGRASGVFVGVVALVGCNAQPAQPGGANDLAVAPPDVGAPGDLASAADLVSPAGGMPDLAASPDLASPSDLAVAPGLVWPPGQAFPSFGPIGALDVIDLTALPADQQTLVVTLAGLVNRARPRIYTADDGGEGKTFWLDKIGAPTTSFSDPFALVGKYQGELAGLVIYDDTLVDTVNLATVIAAQQGGVVASPSVAATLGHAPYSLPVLADLRINHFASKLDVYQYELDHWSANATHRLIVGLNPTIAAHLRDYAVATQAMMVWLDPRVTAESTLLQKFLALLPPTSPYLGWWIDEPTGVQAASTAGVPTFAADWSSNLTVLGGTPRGSAVVAPPPAPPPLENKVYVAIFMSDGDNVQEDQHLIPLKWADAHRGGVPIGWTVDPALVDVAPIILRWFQSSATTNDVLVSGPSGLGYTYPAAWPAASFDSYAKLSGSYLAAAGLQVITVWNNGVDLAANNAHSYATNMPGLVGLTIQDESQAQQLVDGWLPLVRLNVSYGNNEAALESGIDGQLSGWSGAAPLFVAVQGDMNQGSITPTAFWNVQQHYAANSNVEFVRADHFFRLLRASKQPAQHVMLTGDFDGNGKSDALFYYGGDGNWWMGLSDGTNLAWHAAANLASLGNLVDGKHAFYTGDFDGNGKSDVLVYGSADGSWRLGLSDGTNLAWSVASTTPGYGDLLDGAHRTFVGDFSGDGKSDVLFYNKGDGNWWLGTSTGTSLTWAKAASTSGYGNLLDGSHALYTGDFDGNGKRDVLMYYNGDGNWWLGASDGAHLNWSQAASTSGFGNLLEGSHRVVVGDFDGNGKSDVLMYYNGDGNWWLGASDGAHLNWSQAAST